MPIAATTITGSARDLRRRAEPAHRFPRQRAGEGDQQQRVGQRRQQGGATPAVGMALGRRPLAITAAPQASPSPSTSPKLCSASDNSASESVAKP